MKSVMCWLILLCPSVAFAGVWGQENWGQMYWGSNVATTPTEPPAFSVSVEGQDIVVEITNYLPGTGADGWSVITDYRVSCDGADPVIASSNRITVTDLSEETEYTCSVVAINDVGSSVSSNFTATTEYTAGGLPAWLLYEATRARN